MKEESIDKVLESLKSKNTYICKEDLDKLKELPMSFSLEIKIKN